MEGYVRLNNVSSPLQSRANSMVENDTDSTPSPQLAPLIEESSHWWQPLQQCWQQWYLWLNAPPQTPYESGYLTLIPLSDARLRPRRTKLIVFSLLLLAVLTAVGVFLLVPRGVNVGSIAVHSTRMTFNATTLTYRIILQAEVPIYNPNYLKASVTGNVTVSFFDAEAGESPVGPITLPARAFPQRLSVKVDASNLPRKYTQVVYTHCFNFPRKLIFFLLGNFKATYLGYETHLPKIDTYFMLDCSGANDKHVHDTATAAAATLPTAAAAGGLRYRDPKEHRHVAKPMPEVANDVQRQQATSTAPQMLATQWQQRQQQQGQ